MFCDLNIPLPTPGAQLPTAQSKKGKQKHPQNAENDSPLVFTPAQITAIESRIDLLVHLGYTVLALNQVVQSKIDSRTHVNWLQGLVPKLKKRSGIAILKRLTVILDEESEKGNGINPQNASTLAHYDILSLRPTTQTSLSQACLTHSVPSPQTAHVISMPVTLPRLPFHLKHTLIRTALKNGAVFEIDYAGAVGPEAERRNWWGGSREIMRVTKGKGVLLSGGANEPKELRAPRDAGNLVTLLGLPQNLSHDSLTVTPKAIVLRAQSRRIYRSTLSEPKLIIMPQSTGQPTSEDLASEPALPPHEEPAPLPPPPKDGPSSERLDSTMANVITSGKFASASKQSKKRQRDDNQSSAPGNKKKKKKS